MRIHSCVNPTSLSVLQLFDRSSSDKQRQPFSPARYVKCLPVTNKPLKLNTDGLWFLSHLDTLPLRRPFNSLHAIPSNQLRSSHFLIQVLVNHLPLSATYSNKPYHDHQPNFPGHAICVRLRLYSHLHYYFQHTLLPKREPIRNAMP